MKRIHVYSVATVLLLLMAAPLFAQFEPTAGIFKGQFEVSNSYISRLNPDCSGYHSDYVALRVPMRDYLQNSKCALWVMDNYKVSYAFWSLLGEPVCDYKFYWNYNASQYSGARIYHTYNDKKYVIKVSDLMKYPDLKQQLEYISPMPNIRIKVRLKFFNEDFLNLGPGYPIATCIHIINIDLADRAGVTNNFSVPGSGSWVETFTDVDFYHSSSTESLGDRYWLGKNKLRGGYLDPANKEAFERAMKILFQNTKRIVVDLEGIYGIWSLKWPVHEIMRMLDEYCRREEKAAAAKTKSKEPSAKKKEDDFWNTTSSNAAMKGSSDEDFWNTTKVPTEVWAGKLDKAEMLYSQKQWKEARTLYQEVAKANPQLSYAKNKVEFIDKLLAYKPKFEDDYKAVRSEKSPYLFGFKDKQGKLVIDFKYNDASDFSEGMAAVALNSKWGFINYEGTLVIPCIYDRVESFKEGKAHVHTDDKRKVEYTTSDCKNYHSATALLFSDFYIDNNNKPVSEVKKNFRVVALTAKGWDEESNEKIASCKRIWNQVAAKLAVWAVGQGYLEVNW